ncbi:MAG: TetR/AcrR family transcriptional regulator [Alphaproteobacteria bacterium]|nr:MAG: TetR/AcrR family transcriptional regulator [Alphaproteobacteria bacterium]
MSAPIPNTPDRIVHAAMELFGEKGYGSTSVADILRAADANSGSLYHAFPTKQDVLIAVLQRYHEGIAPMLLAPAWEGVSDPIERIFALLGHYRGLLDITDCTFGCPIGSLALEIHEPDPPVRALLAANFDGWVLAVEACLDAAGDRLPPDIDRRGLAQLVLSVMEGGVMQARTYRSLDSFDAGVAALRDYFGRLQAAAPGETP